MVTTDVEAATWQQAARAAGQLLVNDGAVEPAYLDAMVASVEKFGPYMIPVPDVAFFHAAPGEHVTRSAISFVTLREPVFFSEFANQRVRAAFAFGAVDQDSHFGMLANVVALLQDEEFLRLATTGGGREELMGRIRAVLGDEV